MSPRLSIIPAGAVTDRALEPRDLQVLCLLGRHLDKLGWCVRSQVRMAVELDCGRASLQRSLERLVDAGWVEKKRRDQVPEGEEPGRPSLSYAYRVRLDRDDEAWNSVAREPAESYDENASEEATCPPVGTPSEATENGHGGAQPYVGTGAHTYTGTNNDPSERSTSERERDARARDRKARFLVTFEARWPSAAADDRQRTAYAAEALTEEEQESALKGIAPFLENQKLLGRKGVPAGWKYLEQRRWTLLDEPKSDGAPATQRLAANSAEARAVRIVYQLAGRSSAISTFMRSSDGGIWYRKAVTAQLLALAQAPPENEYTAASHQQAGAWNDLLQEFVLVSTFNRLREGSRVPWSWPPRKDGTLSATGPPSALLMTAEDEAVELK